MHSNYILSKVNIIKFFQFLLKRLKLFRAIFRWKISKLKIVLLVCLVEKLLIIPDIFCLIQVWDIETTWSLNEIFLIHNSTNIFLFLLFININRFCTAALSFNFIFLPAFKSNLRSWSLSVVHINWLWKIQTPLS